MLREADGGRIIYPKEKEVNTMSKQCSYPARCALCGGEDCAGAALSRLRLICGYGSTNDGERVELTICGGCADWILGLIQSRMKTQFYAELRDKK